MQTHYDPVEAGKRIRKVRVSYGYSQKELAEISSVTPGFISILEKGKRVMSIDTLLGICDTLETTPNHVLGYQLIQTNAPSKEQKYLTAIRAYKRSDQKPGDVVKLLKFLVSLTKK
ncbi:MAG: helix-turn-helix transcriptional regulator [Nanoarchaeota archaeon]